MRTIFAGPPRAICVWSAEMSAARTASVSSPTSITCSPVATFQTTALPLCPPRPPPASSSLPLRLNLSELTCPCANGSTPSRSRVSAW